MNPRSRTVSVVIPTYNRADLIREALESVFSQTCTAFEVIVVDDGSTDHTTEVLATFGDRVTTIRLARGGISAARNAGVDAAAGEFIAFLDNDDLWVPEKLEKHLDFAAAHPELVVTYTDALQFSQNGIEKKSFADRFSALNDPSRLFTPMIMECAVPLMSAVMINAEFLQRNGLRFQNYAGIDDVALFLQIMMAGGAFGYLPERLTLRRMHENNFSSNHRRRFEQREMLYSDFLRTASGSCTPEQESALRAGLRDAHYRVGECLWEELDLRSARKEFFRALALDQRGMKSAGYGLLSLLPAGFIGNLRRIKGATAR